MAIPTGSGTETLRSHLFNNCNANQIIIYGVKHHVYTVLSVTVHANVLNATDDLLYLQVYGHDGHGGLSAQKTRIAQFNIQVGETYVWNDKFSFNGAEPAGTNVFSQAEQVAIAAQTGTVTQYLEFEPEHTGDNIDLVVTYIDQDWT